MIKRKQQSAFYGRFHSIDIYFIELLEEQPHVAGEIESNLFIWKFLSDDLFLVDLYLHVRGIIAETSICIAHTEY